ncbi:MAG: cytochrome c [Candidatus Sericytochromatia bacterium]|nr:cytochrome c [Candidatus Sericytochromatia bacterium]
MSRTRPSKPWPQAALLGLALGTVVACAGSPTPAQGPASAPAAGGTGVSFRVQVAPVLKASCAGCHAPGGSARPTFLGADGAPVHAATAANAGRIVTSVESGRMPKGSTPKLTAAQVADLKAWQAAGTPDN